MTQTLDPKEDQPGIIRAEHPKLGVTSLYCLPSPQPVEPINGDEDLEVEGEGIVPELLFTENDTNFERLYGVPNKSPYVKDAFHDHIIPSHRPPTRSKTPTPSNANGHVNGDANGTNGASASSSDQEPERVFVNPAKTGTKAAAHYTFANVPGNGGCAVVRLKITPHSPQRDRALNDEEAFDAVIEERRIEADEFYGGLLPGSLSADLKQIARQALAGMLWTKQYYRFIQNEWINGDPAQPAPPPERKWVRNKQWKHMHIEDVLSMP